MTNLKNNIAAISSINSSSAVKLRNLGQSLSTGKRTNDVIARFIVGSLSDKRILLNSVKQEASYAVNVISTAENSLNSVANRLQDALRVAVTASNLSEEQARVLQNSIDESKSAINIAINTAQFDGKSVLSGGMTEFRMQVGPDSSDYQLISISNMSDNKIFRTSIARLVNNWIAADPTAGRTSRYNADELAAAVRNNENLIASGVSGQGTGSGPLMSYLEVGQALTGARDQDPASFAILNNFVSKMPTFMSLLNAQPRNPTLNNATAVDISNVLGDAVQGPVATAELFRFFYDDMGTSVATPSDRQVTVDVLKSALNNVREEQVSLQGQKANLLSKIDALSTVTNITEQTANSYLSGDYVRDSQEYSELIRKNEASISLIPIAEKIPNAILQYISKL